MPSRMSNIFQFPQNLALRAAKKKSSRANRKKGLEAVEARKAGLKQIFFYYLVVKNILACKRSRGKSRAM